MCLYYEHVQCVGKDNFWLVMVLGRLGLELKVWKLTIIYKCNEIDDAHPFLTRMQRVNITNESKKSLLFDEASTCLDLYVFFKKLANQSGVVGILGKLLHQLYAHSPIFGLSWKQVQTKIDKICLCFGNHLN